MEKRDGRVAVVACMIALFVVGCRGERLKFYLHDFSLYRNASLNTAAVEVPASPTMSKPINLFGKLYIFDDPLTSGPTMSSPRVGRAQGMYVYSSRDSNTSAFWAFTAFLGQRGSLSFMGAEFVFQPTRPIPVVGGTGDFAQARGVATLSTAAAKFPNYFALLIDISLQ